MNLYGIQSAPASPFGLPPAVRPSGIESVVLRPLTTQKDIESILHLRDGIDLSAHTGAGRDFRSLEKKETN